MLDKINDYRIDELSKLIKFYNEGVFDNNISRYNMYLDIRNIRDKYFGRNNCIFPYELKGYELSFKTVNGRVYTKETIDNYFKDLEYLIDEVKKIEAHADSILELDNYTKIALSLNHDFNVDVPLVYDCSLVSITIKEGCNSKYFDRAKGFVTDIFPGEYIKEQIAFNVSKSNIEFIKIKDSNENINVVTVKEFEKKYGSLKWFIFKELYSKDYMYLTGFDDEITKRCFKIIQPFISLRNCPTIKYDSGLLSKKSSGEYIDWNIRIKEKVKYTTKECILVHELGHFIHDAIFNNKQIRFPTENKSEYAKKNYFENFAECFTDLAYYNTVNNRTKKMLKILEDII